MNRRRGRLALAAGAVAAALATLALRRAGRGILAPPPLGRPDEWGAWVAARDPVTAAVALLRLLALAGVWYLAIVATVGLTFRLAHANRLVHLADCVTLPAVRRVLAAAAGLTLASGVSPAFALARSGPVPAAAISRAHPLVAAAAPTTTGVPSTTVPATRPPPLSATSAPGRDPPPTLVMRLLPPADAPTAAPAEAAPPLPRPQAANASAEPSGSARTATTWMVRPGECFWSIADDVLTAAWGRPPTDAEIVPYWHMLIESNRTVLADRSNPDLIFPGQVFTVPPVAAPPGG